MKLLALFCILSNLTFCGFSPQDSLLKVYTAIRLRHIAERTAGSESEFHSKCCFSLVSGLALDLKEKGQSPPETGIPGFLSRPIADTSIISPSGFFRIHYFRDSANAPKYDLLSFAYAADSALSYQTRTLGFIAPPTDMGAGGDDRYDIYIFDIGLTYGYTEPEAEISPGAKLYSSYICVNNDFSQFFTKGIDAARVTIAHELHHAIQMGRYALRHDGSEILDRFFYELTSTSMEEFVFPEVNDYHQYLSSYFDYPEKSFSVQSGYNLVIWNLYLTAKFGNSILLSAWERMKQVRALPASELALNAAGSSFKQALPEFGLWCFYTNYRSAVRRYFAESQNYPLLRTTSTGSFTPPFQTPYTSMSNPVSVLPLRVTNKFYGKNDTIVVFIANSDIGGAQSATAAGFTFSLSTQSGENYNPVTDLYYLLFQSDKLNFLTTSVVINNIEAGQSGNSTSDAFVYPNPLVYRGDPFQCLTIPLAEKEQDKEVELAVYNSSLDKVFSGKKLTYYAGKFFVQWFPQSDSERPLSSGVYFYIMKTKNGNKTGKFGLVIQ